MGLVSVSEASQKLGISKEAIHNRIRRGTLECVVVDNIKMVDVSKIKIKSKTVKAVNETKDSNQINDFLLEQNKELKDKIISLELETKSLRDKREEQLILEKQKIESIYKQKDEQLKTVLQVVTSKLLEAKSFTNDLNSNIENDIDTLISDKQDEDIIDIEPQTLISLKKFLKLKGYSDKRIVAIKDRFKKLDKDDDRLIHKKGKIYIDPSKFDYSQLLKKGKH